MTKKTKTGEQSKNVGDSQKQAASPPQGENPPANYRPFWDKWRCCRFFPIDLDEAVALSCNFETEVVDGWDLFGLNDEDLDEFRVRLDIANRAAESGGVFDVVRVPEKDGRETVKVRRLYDFVRWALQMRGQDLKLWKNVPKEFVELAVEAPSPKWPWGDRTTELLDHMAAAGEFWREKYDPAFPATAPTSDDIEKFLLKRKWGKKDFPKRVAEVMAQILRPDDLKSGPRNNS